jgi:hypothetical protein
VVELTAEELEELRGLTYCADVPAAVGGRARIMLWHTENRPNKEIAAMAGVSRPTVDLWLARDAAGGGRGSAGAQARRRSGAGSGARARQDSRGDPELAAGWLVALVVSEDGEVHRPDRRVTVSHH